MRRRHRRACASFLHDSQPIDVGYSQISGMRLAQILDRSAQVPVAKEKKTIEKTCRRTNASSPAVRPSTRADRRDSLGTAQLEHAVLFQPEVKVQGRCPMLLNDKSSVREQDFFARNLG